MLLPLGYPKTCMFVSRSYPGVKRLTMSCEQLSRKSPVAWRLMPVTGESWARMIWAHWAVVMPHTLMVQSGDAENTSS